MAKFKVSFIFQYGSSGWTENWYRDADTPVAACAVTDENWQQYLYPRADGLILRAIRSSLVSNPRVGFLRIMNRAVTVAEDEDGLGGEPPAVALMAQCQCADFHTRTAMFRGMNDADIERDELGNPIINARLLADLIALSSALRGIGAQMQALSLDPVTNPPRLIGQLAQGAGGPSTTALTYTGDAIPVTSKVLIHGLSRQLFPGLQGPLPIISATGDTLTFAVNWRQPQANLPGNGATVRIVNYIYPAVQALVFRDIRTRRTGRPLLGSRGRRSPLRYRSA